MAELTLENRGNMEAVLGTDYPGTNRSVPDELTDMIATIGENMSIRRCHALSVGNGVVAPYVHNALATGIGKIGVLVALESEGDKDALKALGKQIAMHVAATLPRWVSRDEVAAEDLDRERVILTEQARATGRPENIIEKMVEGRLRKFMKKSSCWSRPLL
jgi:elongation factor Ts